MNYVRRQFSVFNKLFWILCFVLAEYQHSLHCLQGVLDRDDLSECDSHWSTLEPFLANITSYEFYCQAHNPKTKGMVQALEQLRSCFEVVFSVHCNADTGSMMSELIRRAFDDPFYLLFAYRADCDLHRMDSSKGSSPSKRRHGRHNTRRHYGNGRVPNSDDTNVPSSPHGAPRQGASSDSVQHNNLTSGVKLLNYTSLQTLCHLIACALLTLCFNSRFVLRWESWWG